MNGHDYYNNARTEIADFLPEKLDKILDVGCGAGTTVGWIRQNRRCVWIGGVELHPDAAAKARGKLDSLYEGSIEEIDLPIEENSLDLILCLDILEHLVDPWSVTCRLQKLLKPGGSMIASIPNVRSKKVILPLLFKGKWDYQEFGILDKTHLRFFTRDSAISMLEAAGLKVDKIDVTGGFTRGWQGKVLKKILPEGIKSFFVRQYIMRGIK